MFYIGKRYNPQLDTTYYKAYGNLSKLEAKKKEQCIYGSLYLTEYKTETEYNAAIDQMQRDGNRFV